MLYFIYFIIIIYLYNLIESHERFINFIILFLNKIKN